jgi:hypothetical protein
VTEFGNMMDFIKAFPSVTKEQYMWEWTVPQIRLASADNTHVIYLTEEQAEMRKAKKYNGSNIEELSDLGIPIFNTHE